MGLVGTGQIVSLRHLPAALSSPLMRVTALVDLVPDRARALADQFGLAPRVSGAVAEVLDVVDGLLIATPNHTHHDLALTAVKGGLPVLVEKPLTIGPDQARALVRASADHGVLVAVGYSTRYWANQRRLTQLLEARVFGSVRRFVYQLGMSQSAPPISRYSFRRASAGGGVLVVNGIHFLDRMLQWFGPPDSVSYQDDAEGGPESAARAHLRFERDGDPLEGSVRLTKAFDLPSGVVLETDVGLLSLAESPSAPIIFRAHATPECPFEHDAGAFNPLQPFRAQFEDFVAACRGKPSDIATAARGLEAIELISELYAARSQTVRTNALATPRSS